MPSTRVLAFAVVLTAALVAFLLLRSGADEDDPEAAPADYATYNGEFGDSRFEFTYPEAWGEVTEREGSGPDEAFFEIEGDASAEGTTPSIRLGVQLDSASPEAILQANLAAAQAQGSEVEVGDEEPVDVVGAVEALRADAVYPVSGEDGASSEFATTIVVAQAPDETIFSLIVSDRPDAGELDLDAVVGSLSIGPAGEAVDA